MGAFSKGQIEQLLSDGHFRPSDHIWIDGPGWVELGSLIESVGAPIEMPIPSFAPESEESPFGNVVLAVIFIAALVFGAMWFDGVYLSKWRSEEKIRKLDAEIAEADRNIQQSKDLIRAIDRYKKAYPE